MLMTDEEIKALIPTVTLRGQKPVTMAWLKQPDAIIAMRNVEAVKEREIEALKKQIDDLRERIRLMRVFEQYRT